jgi:PST family polysaccharide transporter
VDFAWSVVNVLLTWLCVEWLGFKGAGVAFFASYVLHLFIVYPVARRISGFRWAPATLRTGAMFVVVVAIVEIALITLPQPVGLSVGIMTMLLMGVYAFSTLRALVRGERPGLDAPAPPQRSER